MRILEHGTKAKIKTCPECSCKFEFDVNDINVEIEEEKTTKTVTCPGCGKVIEIEE